MKKKQIQRKAAPIQLFEPSEETLETLTMEMQIVQSRDPSDRTHFEFGVEGKLGMVILVVDTGWPLATLGQPELPEPKAVVIHSRQQSGDQAMHHTKCPHVSGAMCFYEELSPTIAWNALRNRGMGGARDVLTSIYHSNILGEGKRIPRINRIEQGYEVAWMPESTKNFTVHHAQASKLSNLTSRQISETISQLIEGTK